MRLVINYFKKYPYALVMLLVMLVWMAVNSIEGAKASKDLEKEGLYTLATIKEINGAKSGRWITVSFMYNGQQYETEGKNETIPLSWVGEKIFIKFLPARPVDADFLEGIEVSDSLKKLPPTIWKNLPIKNDKTSLIDSAQQNVSKTAA